VCSSRTLLADTGTGAATASRASALASIKAIGYRIVLMIGACSNNVQIGEDMKTLGMQDGYALFTISNLDELTCYSSALHKLVNSTALNNTMNIAMEFPTGDKFQAFAAKACECDACPSQHEIALLSAVHTSLR
jgi:hypothetical protein